MQASSLLDLRKKAHNIAKSKKCNLNDWADLQKLLKSYYLIMKEGTHFPHLITPRITIRSKRSRNLPK